MVQQLELYDDQIHAPAFQKLCKYFWSDDIHRPVKSGVWEYALQCAKDYDMKLINHTCMPETGVIFVGMCHLIENIFKQMPKTGSYIIVHRTNDRSFTPAMYALKPASVKHIYTCDSEVVAPDVSAIPFGNASINGYDDMVKLAAQQEKRLTDKRLFVCYNTNKFTPHRNASIPALRDKPFAFVFELNYPTVQMPPEEFNRNVKDHEFTMALAGCGKDASRQWMAIQLGSIPIVTDCIEMRHFADLPLVFCPENFNDITDEWLTAQAKEAKGKSTERMRMSYWEKHINAKKLEHGIS